MKRFSARSLPLVAVALICASIAATAQTGRRRVASADALSRQIMALRSEVAEAIRTRNRRTLERIYADDFTHTHASGQVDNKQRRIAALVSGEPTIESADADEISVRTYGATTAIVIGQSTISGRGENSSAIRYRWIAVYIRRANRWQIAASQATRIASG